MKYYYEFGVSGSCGFSACVVSDKPLDEDEVVLKAYADDLMHDDDCHYVSYVEEIEEFEYNERFNH